MRIQAGEASKELVVTYPSYKSFDPFIDVKRLKSLDPYLTERIHKHAATGTQDLFSK
jgi:hypothetical protein